MISEKGAFKFLVYSLVIVSLFTLTQAYYSAYIHLALLILCILLCKKEQAYTLGFILSGVATCTLFVVLSFIKNNGSAMEHVGFYLHYITWPFLFVCVIHRLNHKEIKHLLFFIIGLCIIGDILTLIQLSIHPDISRLLAGAQLQDEKISYYKLGVGGYGYIFAMAFMMYGIVRWLKRVKSRPEKLILIIFLVINAACILYAAYTMAIILAIVLLCFALTADMKITYRIVLSLVVGVLLLAFGTQLLEICYNLAKSLDLRWVAKRFEQLLQSQQAEDLSSLKRVVLYGISWNSFWENPIFGGGDYGGHSQVLDLFAQYGILAVFLPFFFGSCQSLCNRFLGKAKVFSVFLAFLIFACIDTCSVMQIPVAVFFVVPLMLYEALEENKL